MPHGPVLMFLIRQASYTYGMHGVYLWVLALDVNRFRPLIILNGNLALHLSLITPKAGSLSKGRETMQAVSRHTTLTTILPGSPRDQGHSMLPRRYASQSPRASY